MPYEGNMKAFKVIFQYIKDAYHLGMKYFNKNTNQLVGYNDSNLVGNGNDKTSTSTYMFHLRFGSILCPCKKKWVVSLFIVEVEYRGVVNVGNEVAWTLT